MTRTPAKLATLLAAVAVLASGCGMIPGTTDAVPVLGARKGELRGFKEGHLAKGGFGFKGGPGAMGGPGAKGGLFPGVELTADQQAQLKALMEKYKPAAPDKEAMKAAMAAKKANAEALRKALTADPFDAEALRAALTADAGEAGPKPAHDPQLLVEARAILTDEQRAAAIAKLKAMPAPKVREARADKPDVAAKLGEKLGLNDDQKAKLVALSAALEAARPTHDPAAHHAAMIKLLETGDASGLTPPAKPARPVDAIVAFVGSLDATQRGKLAKAGPRLGLGFGGDGPKHAGGAFGGGFGGGHGKTTVIIVKGGRGGHGGHGGPGPKGGFGR